MKWMQPKFLGTILALALVFSVACQQADQAATETDPAAEPAAPAPEQGSNASASQLAPQVASAPVPPPAPAAPPAPAPPRTATLEAGTMMSIRLANTLSTKTNVTGDTFEARLESPLIVNGREVASSGTTLMGRVVESDPGGRVKGVASMAIELIHLHTADGEMLDISTNLISLEAESSKTKDATKVGIGSVLGAAIGAIAGGGKGAAIGGAAGAGAGTGMVLATRGDAAEIGSETVLDFELSSPVTVQLP